jgi:sugar (pentulose or hexulose) kinase
MWFQDKLPKPDERPNSRADDRASIVNRSVDEEFAFLLSEKVFWLPAFFQSSSARGQMYHGVVHAHAEAIHSPASHTYFKGFQRKTPELERYVDGHQAALSSQTSQDHLTASVLEYNALAFTDQHDREQEWNTIGLESGLNPMVRGSCSLFEF